MGHRKTVVRLDSSGIDYASETMGQWLVDVKEKRENIIRARLTIEELLLRIARHFGEAATAELHFRKGIGGSQFLIRYGGERFYPMDLPENELEEWSAEILSRLEYVPSWRYRFRKNELLFRLPGFGVRSELVMVASIVAAIAVGLLGSVIPTSVKTAISDYALVFLSDGVLGLLNTFIGLVIFLSIVLGICGIGNATAFGRIGKLMVSRFLAFTFLLTGVNILLLRCFFHLNGGVAEGGDAQIHAILELLFGILPKNPVRPFLDGNTLQILFLATLIGAIILLLGSQTEDLHTWLVQVQAVTTRAVSVICKLLPVYVFSSLVLQFWSSGSKVILQLWKPVVCCAFISVILIAGYAAVVCLKLKVRLSVLLPKLLPGYLIALSTASFASALPTAMEVNEKRLGIAPELSKTGTPIGGMLNVGCYSLLYLTCGIYLAEKYGVGANAAWWITLWIVCALLAISTPPVAGATVSCLVILSSQMGIPAEGIALGVVLSTLLDFICTGSKVPILHMELLLQADRLGLLDREQLYRRS